MCKGACTCSSGLCSGETPRSMTTEGGRSLACTDRPEGNKPAVRKEFAPRRLVLLLNQTREQWQEFFIHFNPSLISSTNALAELKSIDV